MERLKFEELDINEQQALFDYERAFYKAHFVNGKTEKTSLVLYEIIDEDRLRPLSYDGVKIYQVKYDDEIVAGTMMNISRDKMFIEQFGFKFDSKEDGLFETLGLFSSMVSCPESPSGYIIVGLWDYARQELKLLGYRKVYSTAIGRRKSKGYERMGFKVEQEIKNETYPKGVFLLSKPIDESIPEFEF